MNLSGLDEDGTPFDLPPIQTMIQGLYFKNATVFEYLAHLLCILSTIGVFTRANIKYFIIFYAFARLSYNVILGSLLSSQSKYRTFTNFVTTCMKTAHEGRMQFIRFCLIYLMEKGGPKNVHDYPLCFQAWLIFKHIENLVMWTDGWSFCVLAIRCTDFSRYSFLFDHNDTSQISKQPLCNIFLDIIGLLLIYVNYLVKRNAHIVQGAYAWFYGDFFFRLTRPLVFDGIYRFVKHPMYTLGYTAYIGLSIISRSWVVTIAALFGYSLQICFLVFVENPHIERTYGNKERTIDS